MTSSKVHASLLWAPRVCQTALLLHCVSLHALQSCVDLPLVLLLRLGLLCQATGIGCWLHRSDCSASMCTLAHANATACCCCWHYMLKPYCPYSKWLLLWSTSIIQAMCSTLSRTLGAKMRKQSWSAPDTDTCLLLSHTNPQHTQLGKLTLRKQCTCCCIE